MVLKFNPVIRLVHPRLVALWPATYSPKVLALAQGYLGHHRRYFAHTDNGIGDVSGR